MKTFKQLKEQIIVESVSHPIFNKGGNEVTGAKLERNKTTGKLVNTAVNSKAPPLKGSFINNHSVNDHPDIEDHIGYIKRLVNSGVPVHYTDPNGQPKPVTKDNVDSVSDSIRSAHKGSVPTEYSEFHAEIEAKQKEAKEKHEKLSQAEKDEIESKARGYGQGKRQGD